MLSHNDFWLAAAGFKKKNKLVDQSHLYSTNICKIFSLSIFFECRNVGVGSVEVFFQGLNPNYIDQSNPVL